MEIAQTNQRTARRCAGRSSYSYTLQRGAATPSSGSADLPMITLGQSFAGEQIQIAVRAVDGAGNVGAPASVALTVIAPPADTTPPTLSLVGASARYSSAQNTTLVDWAPADDPDLSDGGPSGGIDNYTVTYRLDGGASVTTTTEMPRLQLTGGRAGQAIQLTVTARDAAGRTSTPQASNLTSQAWTPPAAGETLACAPTEDGVPPSCNDPAGGGEVAGGPVAQLTSTSAGAGGQLHAAATGLDRFHIDVEGLWTTARLRPGSYVVGNVKSGGPSTAWAPKPTGISSGP